MQTTSLLYFGNKDLEEIQQIVTSTKAANLAKHVVRVTADLALIVKKRQPERTVMKSKPEKEYFNCGKKDHYVKDCYSFI